LLDPDGINDRAADMKAWEEPPSDRIEALITAYGNRYDGHPGWQALGFVETAMGEWPGVDHYAFYENWKDWVSVGETAFPHAIMRFMTNWTTGFDDAAMKDMFDHCASLDNCMPGGPDPNVDYGIPLQSHLVYKGERCNNCTPEDFRPQMGFVMNVEDIGLTNPPFPSTSDCTEQLDLIVDQANDVEARWLVLNVGNACADDVLQYMDDNPTPLTTTSCPANIQAGGGCNFTP
jgi:hypothetical protein